MKRKQEEYKRICPQCNTEFYANHLSRKYCTADCKSIFNNRKARGQFENLKSFLKPIKKNLSILEMHYLFDEIELTSETLISEGFDFNAFTDRLKIPGTELYNLHFGKFVLRRNKENNFTLSKDEK